MRNPNRETTFRFQRFSVENRRSAMKVGTDGVLLGAWAELFQPESSFDDDGGAYLRSVPRFLDVGAGTGLISLMLAQRFPDAVISAIEIEGGSAEECAVNFSRSPWPERLYVVRADFLTEQFTEVYDLIVSNPPFFNNGAVSPNDVRQTARHEDSLPLGKLIEHSASLLNPGVGALALVLPADRCADAEFAAEVAGLRLWRKVMVTTVQGKEPRRVLLQFVNASDTLIRPSVSTEVLADIACKRSPWYRRLMKDFYLNP